jgi:hypothetical protein
VIATPLESLAEPPGPGALVLLHVPLAEGFAVPEIGLRVFTDAEVFGFRKPRHPERRRRRRLVGSFLADLRPGDHVVHEDSGVARFEGFENKQVGGVSRESLVLTFADGTRWLPTERIDKITRYVGGDRPALSVMGGADWTRTKRKAKKAAEGEDAHADSLAVEVADRLHLPVLRHDRLGAPRDRARIGVRGPRPERRVYRQTAQISHAATLTPCGCAVCTTSPRSARTDRGRSGSTATSSASGS